MTPTMRKHLLDLMKRHKTMTIATVRATAISKPLP
jgi:hypothetical protein